MQYREFKISFLPNLKSIYLSKINNFTSFFILKQYDENVQILCLTSVIFLKKII